MKKRPVIIFDTDMDTDCDDAGALMMLIKAHISGDISLKGIIADSVCEYAAPFCKKMLDYYDLNIPVGEIYGRIEVTDRFSDYLKHQRACSGSAYNRALSERTEKFEDSTELYRSLLEESADGGVTVLCVGMLTAVREVIKRYPLLFKKKVSRVVIMCNPYKDKDFNLYMDARSSKEFFNLCPSPIYVSYLGRGIITGEKLKNALPEDHPVRQAYRIYNGGCGRDSWDLIASLFAMYPDSPLFSVKETGAISYDDVNGISVIDTTIKRDKIIELNCPFDELKDTLNGMLT